MSTESGPLCFRETSFAGREIFSPAERDHQGSAQKAASPLPAPCPLGWICRELRSLLPLFYRHLVADTFRRKADASKMAQALARPALLNLRPGLQARPWAGRVGPGAGPGPGGGGRAWRGRPVPGLPAAPVARSGVRGQAMPVWGGAPPAPQRGVPPGGCPHSEGSTTGMRPSLAQGHPPQPPPEVSGPLEALITH